MTCIYPVLTLGKDVHFLSKTLGYVNIFELYFYVYLPESP